VGFADAVKTCLRKYAVFSGRARRSEYWYFRLFLGLLGLVLGIVFAVVAGSIAAAAGASGSETMSAGGTIAIVVMYLLVLVVSLAVFLPSLAAEARRLHDTGKSAWWILLELVPGGGIVLIVFCAMDSTPGPNEHGPNPKGVGGGYGQFPGQPPQFGGPGQQYGQQPGPF
jgi:uncharacterized membrane protein YhaH (DUF805 family)